MGSEATIVWTAFAWIGVAALVIRQVLNRWHSAEESRLARSPAMQ